VRKKAGRKKAGRKKAGRKKKAAKKKVAKGRRKCPIRLTSRGPSPRVYRVVGVATTRKKVCWYNETDETVEITFDTSWPFTQARRVIRVRPKKNSAKFTLAEPASRRKFAYSLAPDATPSGLSDPPGLDVGP
jgi:hypothetical protein